MNQVVARAVHLSWSASSTPLPLIRYQSSHLTGDFQHSSNRYAGRRGVLVIGAAHGAPVAEAVRAGRRALALYRTYRVAARSVRASHLFRLGPAALTPLETSQRPGVRSGTHRESVRFARVRSAALWA